MRRESAVLLLIMGALPCAHAQDSLQNKQLEALVVTGQYEPQSARKSVYQVRTIPMELIQERGSVKLQDILNTELNIRFNQDLSLGGSNLSMQGLQGQNVKVLVDGVPMVGRQGTSNEININQINVNTIERIEIIEGPMSVVYGADALAGVINIITKKSAEGKMRLSAKVHEESIGSTYGVKNGIHNESVSFGYNWSKWYLNTDLTRNYFGGWKGDSTGREMTWHPKTQYLASVVGGYRTEPAHYYYRLDYLNEDIYNPGNYQGNEALDQHYYTNRFMHQFQGQHAFSKAVSLNGALSYTSYNRKTQTVTVDKTTGEVALSLGAGQQDVTAFDGMTLRSTLQYKISPTLNLQPGIDFYHEKGSGGRIDGVQSLGDYAAFVSGEWKISEAIQIRPGFRFIHNTAYAAPPVVPSLNAKISIGENHEVRLSYGRGFRAPSLRELYFNFFDASHSIRGNPDLKPEKSQSFNASWNWKAVTKSTFTYSTTLGAFYNLVDDMIGYGVDPGNPTITTYINIDHYKTQGITLANHLRIKNLESNVGFSYTGRFNQYSESVTGLNEYTWSPEVNTTTTYRWPASGWSVSFFYKYTGQLPYYQYDTASGTAVLNILSGYNWADLTIQKSLGKSWVFNGGVRNLFDVITIGNTGGPGTAHSGGGAQAVGYGRSAFLSVTYSINQ